MGIGYFATVGATQHAAALTSGLSQGTRCLVRRDLKGAALCLLGGVVEPVALTARMAGYAVEDAFEATKDIAALVTSKVAGNRLSAQPASGVNGVAVEN